MDAQGDIIMGGTSSPLMAIFPLFTEQATAEFTTQLEHLTLATETPISPAPEGHEKEHMDDLISRSKTISDLLLHLHKSSSLLADLNVQKAPEVYEEKKGQVKVKLDEINAQIVRFREKEKSDDQQESQREAVQQRLEVLRQVIKQKRHEQQSIVTHAGHAARVNYTKAALLRQSCRSCWKRKGVEKKKAVGTVTERNEKTKKQRKFAWYFQRGGFPWL